MFPNDDICNVRAAKNAARRIFEKYSVIPSQKTQSKGLGQSEVSGLIKNAYGAINMAYDPSLSDVSSFMSVFGVGQNGTIQLDKLEELAVKYLCGEEVLKLENNHHEQQDNEKASNRESMQNNFIQSNKQKPEIQLENQQPNSSQLKDAVNQASLPISQPNNKQYNLKFLSPKATESKSYFSSKQNTSTSIKSPKQEGNKINKKLTYSQILNQANQIFNQHKNIEKYGITAKQASQVLTKTYRLIGKTKFNPSEEDVKIWMKLCDVKKNGVVQWVSYQNFIKRMMERQNIFESHQN